MPGSMYIALILPCAGMSTVFIVYICFMCYVASVNLRDTGNREFQSSVKPQQGKGLSAADLEKLPGVNGHDLVLGTDCAVCLDEIESEQPARMIPGCNHGFHLKCADAWLLKNPNCPICRAKIGPEFFNPPVNNPC